MVLTYRFLLRSRIVEPRHARWLWAAMLNRDPTLYYESGKAAWRFDARSWVGEIEAPMMVIIPTNDQVVPTRTQHELAALIEADRVVEMAGAGHESILSRPTSTSRPSSRSSPTSERRRQPITKAPGPDQRFRSVEDHVVARSVDRHVGPIRGGVRHLASKSCVGRIAVPETVSSGNARSAIRSPTYGCAPWPMPRSADARPERC